MSRLGVRAPSRAIGSLDAGVPGTGRCLESEANRRLRALARSRSLLARESALRATREARGTLHDMSGSRGGTSTPPTMTRPSAVVATPTASTARRTRRHRRPDGSMKTLERVTSRKMSGLARVRWERNKGAVRRTIEQNAALSST
jgi:hypothetical protein